MRGRSVVSVGLALLVASATGTVGERSAAAQPPSIETRATDARKACLTGDYQRGANLLAELFADTSDATYIYNEARCYQQNSRPTEAINLFREYLRVAKNLPADVVTETEGHIREMEKQKAASAPATPPPSVTPPPATTPPMGSAPIVIGTSPPASDAGGGGNAGRTQRTAGIIVASVGGAALLGGVIFGLKAKGAQSDVEKVYDPSVYDSGKSAATMQWVFYGIGAAAVATGAVLYTLGLRAASQESTSVSFVPALDPRAPGGALRVVF